MGHSWRPHGRIVRGDVGRVADDEIEALARERLIPVARAELDPGKRERCGVGARHGERLLRHIGRDQPPAGALAREREREGARTGAEIRDAPLGRRMQCQGALHQELRLRSRDQHRRGDREAQRPEVPVAGEISDGLAGGVSCEKPPVLCDPRGMRAPLRLGLEARARHREILDSAFRIFRATLVKCLPYAIAAVIAGQLPNIYYLVSGRNMLQGLAGFRDPVWVTLYILGYVIAIVLWSAVLLRQYALSTGH